MKARKPLCASFWSETRSRRGLGLLGVVLIILLVILVIAVLGLIFGKKKDPCEFDEPVITEVSPLCVSTKAPTRIEILGEHLIADATIKLAGQELTDLVAIEGGLTATVPPIESEGRHALSYAHTVPHPCESGETATFYESSPDPLDVIDAGSRTIRIEPGRGCESGWEWVDVVATGVTAEAWFLFGPEPAIDVIALEKPSGMVGLPFRVLTPPGLGEVPVHPQDVVGDCVVTGEAGVTFQYIQCEVGPIATPRAELLSEREGPVLVALGNVLLGDALDCVAANLSGDVSVFRGDGAGGLVVEAGLSSLGIIADLALGDLNGDGWDELVLTFPDTGGVAALENAKGEGFDRRRVETQIVGGRPGALVLTDFDGDGNLDVVLGDAGVVGVLPGAGDGSFRVTGASRFDVPNRTGDPGLTPPVADLLAVDVDGDGDEDLVVATGRNMTLELLLNDSAPGGAAGEWVDFVALSSGGVPGARIERLALGDAVDVVYTPRWNVFRGQRRLELLLRDFRPSRERVESEPRPTLFTP